MKSQCFINVRILRRVPAKILLNFTFVVFYRILSMFQFYRNFIFCFDAASSADREYLIKLRSNLVAPNLLSVRCQPVCVIRIHLSMSKRELLRYNSDVIGSIL